MVWKAVQLFWGRAPVTPASDYQIRQIIKSFSGGPYRNITKPTEPCKAPRILLGALQGAQNDLVIRRWG